MVIDDEAQNDGQLPEVEAPASPTPLLDADAVQEVGRAATPPSDTHADLFPWTSLRDPQFARLDWDDSHAESDAMQDADSVSLGRRSISLMSPDVSLTRRAPRISALTGMSPTQVTGSPRSASVYESRMKQSERAEEQSFSEARTNDTDARAHLSAAAKDFSVYMRLVAQAIDAHRTLRFDDLVRHRDTRTAAHAFSHLLALASENEVRIEQREAFGPIYIHA